MNKEEQLVAKELIEGNKVKLTTPFGELKVDSEVVYLKIHYKGEAPTGTEPCDKKWVEDHFNKLPVTLASKGLIVTTSWFHVNDITMKAACLADNVVKVIEECEALNHTVEIVKKSIIATPKPVVPELVVEPPKELPKMENTATRKQCKEVLDAQDKVIAAIPGFSGMGITTPESKGKGCKILIYVSDLKKAGTIPLSFPIPNTALVVDTVVREVGTIKAQGVKA